jgi:hypothetical protein
MCGYELDRIHRSPLERALSRVYPVIRFGCSNAKCGWAGRIMDRDKTKARLLWLLLCAIGFAILYKFSEWMANH